MNLSIDEPTRKRLEGIKALGCPASARQHASCSRNRAPSTAMYMSVIRKASPW